MCLLRVPRHPWCLCPDPDARDAQGHILCPHHVWIRPDSASLEALSPADKALLDETLAALPRPAPTWEHCATYKAQHAALLPPSSSSSSGDVLPGHELHCPETVARQQRIGTHKDFYAWDSLCAHCERPGRGVPLRLVRLRPRYEPETDEYEFSACGGDAWQESYECGFVRADHADHAAGDGESEESEQLGEVLEKRLVRGRTARDGAERLFVDVVHGPAMGRWEVDIDKSAVYLLPGEPFGWSMWGMGLEKREVKKAAAAGGSGWMTVKAVTKMVGSLARVRGNSGRFF